MTISFSAEQNGFAHESPSIVVVDCHLLSRSCLARIFRSEFHEFAVVEVETVHRYDTSMAGRQVSLVSLNIQGCAMTDMRVIECLAHLRQMLPDAPTVLLTQLDESTISDATISEVTRYGVRGYITASASIEIALAAVRLVMAGGVYFPRSVPTDCANAAPAQVENIFALQPLPALNGMATDLPASTGRTDVAFTERERQVLATLLRGLSNKVIASELNLSQNTVKSHVSHIMRKLHATNRTEAVVLSQYNGPATA
ncbi:response regulator transcription factor [Aminobacter sp. AP02]|uniref:response regulator transcription factor n=1 Tax=Aminobacter sp. AP02 TaxID=2135737 RepID=UPI000D6D819F|nr:response regulator transcription factor [Aminobacter sp. AP02]PWK76331.1 DNA-binding NarL/FixJ family response regulator [Aminobacter sp. AP02]